MKRLLVLISLLMISLANADVANNELRSMSHNMFPASEVRLLLDYLDLERRKRILLLGESERFLRFPGLSFGSGISVIGDPNRGAPELSSVDRKSSRNAGQEASEVTQPPFRRRIVVSIVAFIVGNIVMVKGWSVFYDGRRLKGRLIAYLGIFLWICAGGLWLSSGFKWSWGWPI